MLPYERSYSAIMQIRCYQYLIYISLGVLLNCSAPGILSASPESNAYSPSEIHHYKSNGGAPTVTVLIVAHTRFENGKYVWKPARYAEAPLPENKDRVAIWVPGSGSTHGHWAKNVQGTIQ